MVVIYRNKTVLKITLNFALRMARSVKQHCAAQCIDLTQFRAGYGAFSAEWFAMLK